MYVPDGHIFGDTFYGFFQSLTAFILLSPNPTIQAEMAVAELRHVVATGDFDHIEQSSHLHWLRPHLPKAREQWPIFIQSVLVMVLAVLVWARTCPTDVRQTPIKAEALIDSCRAITACEQLVAAIVSEAWSRADPFGFLANLSDEIQSMHAPEALHRACEKTLPWLKSFVSVTQERATGWLDDTMIFVVIPWLCAKWKKRKENAKPDAKPPKPGKAEIERDAREAWEEYGKSQGWWK